MIRAVLSVSLLVITYKSHIHLVSYYYEAIMLEEEVQSRVTRYIGRIEKPIQ